MATRTKADLATVVLRDYLQEIDSVEAPEANDSTTVQSIYDDLFARWRKDGVAFWPPDAIPDYVFRTVAKAVANEASIGFGGQRSEQVAVAMRNELAELNASPPSGEPVKSEYF